MCRNSIVGIVGISNRYVWNIIDLARSNGNDVLLVANLAVPDSVGIEAYKDIYELVEQERNLPFFSGVVRPESKVLVVRQAESFGLRFPGQLISDVASIGYEVEIGKGVIIRQRVVVDSFVSIADHVTLSPGTIVGHHASIGAFSHLANGAIVSGDANLGSGVYVGVGAVIRDGVTIGDGATIGMGAVVVKDVEPGQTMIGNPAREMAYSART